MKTYRLKLKRLDFISAVDAGAQGPVSNVALIKRAKQPGEMDATFRVSKVDAALGLVFGWALASSLDGGKTPHVDLQADAIVGGDELIKVAAAFMEAGAASDVMHDGEADGRVVFCMPLTKDVSTALGIKSEVEGLAIAMRPSPETFKRFQSGELAAFSIGGIGERELMKSIRKDAKLYTDEVDGHQHLVYLDDEGCCSTSYATSAGATCGHSHAVSCTDGAIMILADSGHTHTIAPGQASVIVAPPGSIVVQQPDAVEMRANSTRPAQVGNLSSHPEPKMTTTEQQISDLTKRLERAERIVKLTPAERAHFDSIGGDAADDFLAKSLEQRTEIVKFATEVVHTCADGTQIFKRDGDLALRLAKQGDEAIKVANVEKALRELAEIRKRAADTIGNLAGSDEAHVDVLRAVDGISDATKRTAALATLKAANDAMARRAVAKGVGGEGVPVGGSSDDAMVALEKGLTSFCKAQGIVKNLWTSGLDAFTRTTEGAALKAAYDAASVA